MRFSNLPRSTTVPHTIPTRISSRVNAMTSVDKKTRTLMKYRAGLQALQKLGKSWDLSEEQIDQVMRQSLGQPPKENSSQPQISEGRAKIMSCLRVFFKILLSVFIFFLALYAILQHKPTQYFIQSKLQDYIYPGMKFVRKIFLPLIISYPSLTGLYDESCLIPNPYFRVPDLPCPCESVRAILNLTGEDRLKQQCHAGIPYIMKMDKAETDWETLQNMYFDNQETFDRDANYVTVLSHGSTIFRKAHINLFIENWEPSSGDRAKSHVIWRSNRLEPSRVLRTTFGLPGGEPNYAAGIVIEKLVVIDGPQAASHHVPGTEGTTVFIQQASGSRLIVLSPSRECSDKCISVSVLLPPSHILWYSWWYWRGTSFPDPGSDVPSIQYIGSYQ